jgi:hypothetical protein
VSNDEVPKASTKKDRPKSKTKTVKQKSTTKKETTESKESLMPWPVDEKNDKR